MPSAPDELKCARPRILDAIMFENWIRFYFMEEESGDALRIKIPGERLELIKNLYPGLYPLAETLNNLPVEFETSRNAVINLLMNNREEAASAVNDIQNIFSSRDFQIQLQLFHTWLQTHTALLEQKFTDFGEWRDIFNEWSNSSDALKLTARSPQN